MASWSSFPDEVKAEVLNFTDFYSSNNLRLCSKSDQGVVESLKTKIPFLKINIALDHVAVIVVENPSQILRVDLKYEDDLQLGIYRSPNLECESSAKILKSPPMKILNFSEEVSNLFNGFFQRNLDIESCSIENEDVEKDHENLKVLAEKLSRTQPKRLILSGKSFLETQKCLKSQNKTKISSEVLIRTWRKDISKNWSGFEPYVFKAYPVSRFESKQGAQEHIMSTVHIEIYTYVAMIQAYPSRKKKIHWIPGYHTEDPERKLRTFRDVSCAKFPTHTIVKIPADSKDIVFVKFTECGVSIRVVEEKNYNMEDPSCDLEWMCSICKVKTMEDWYHRETIGNLHESGGI